MTTSSTRDAHPAVAAGTTGGRDWRSLAFRVAVACIVALLAALTGPLLAQPWTTAVPATPDYTPELHRWHDALIAAYSILLVAGSLLAAFRHPRRFPLLVQFPLLATGLLSFLALAPLSTASLTAAAVIALLIFATYPVPSALLAFGRGSGASRPLVALATATAVPLLLSVWTNLRLQQLDASEHAIHGHWHGAAAVTLTLVLAGFLAASRRPGWAALGVLTGVTYLYLGVAALALPSHDGSWGVRGGALTLLAGAAYLALTAWEARRGGARDAADATGEVGRPIETPALS